MSRMTGRLAALALAVGLASGAVPGPALAAGTQTATVDVWASPTGQRFADTVHTCEDRTARGTLGDLRDCVRGIAGPDPTQAEIMDLWSIFMYCLSLMSDAGPDAMYPTSHYEDKVNACLGL